uniref:Ovule protein n=1 Tax=Caenorhabditis tropicalis TaxID=1561998 RepID=A0A1I7TY28_9PELO
MRDSCLFRSQHSHSLHPLSARCSLRNRYLARPCLSKFNLLSLLRSCPHSVWLCSLLTINRSLEQKYSRRSCLARSLFDFRACMLVRKIRPGFRLTALTSKKRNVFTNIKSVTSEITGMESSGLRKGTDNASFNEF